MGLRINEIIPLFDEDLMFEENPDEFHTRIEEYDIAKPLNLVNNKEYTEYLYTLGNQLLEEDSMYYKVYISKDGNVSPKFVMKKMTINEDDEEQPEIDKIELGEVFFDPYSKLIDFDGHIDESIKILIENYKSRNVISNNRYTALNILFILCDTERTVKQEQIFPYYDQDSEFSEIVCRIRYDRKKQLFEIREMKDDIVSKKFKDFIDKFVNSLNDNFNDNILMFS